MMSRNLSLASVFGTAVPVTAVPVTAVLVTVVLVTATLFSAPLVVRAQAQPAPEAELLQATLVEPGSLCKVCQTGECALTTGTQNLLGILLAETLNQAKSQSNDRFPLVITLECAVPARAPHTHRPNFDARALDLGHQGPRAIEAHGLAVHESRSKCRGADGDGLGDACDPDPGAAAPEAAIEPGAPGGLSVISGSWIEFSAADEDPESTPLSYQWSFPGCATPAEAWVKDPGPVLFHCDSGLYPVRLEVTDEQGQRVERRTMVNVIDPTVPEPVEEPARRQILQR